MRKPTFTLAACLGSVLFGAGTLAQQETSPRTQTEPRTSTSTSPGDQTSRAEDMSDRRVASAMGGEHTPDEFVRTAAQDGMAEVELGKLALQKTQNEQVRSFADRMIKDHSKANAELASIAKKSNLTVPTEPAAQHKAMMQQLRGKSGAEFDAAYSKHMVEDHNKAVELFRMASTMEGFDKELQSFAKKTLPTLEDHRKQAKSLAAAHGGKKMGSEEGSGSSNH